MTLINIITNITYFEKNSGYVLRNDNVFNIFSGIKKYVSNKCSLHEFGEYLIIIDNKNFGYIFSAQNISELRIEDFQIRKLNYPYIIFYKKIPDRINGIYNIIEDEVLFSSRNYIGEDIFFNNIYTSDNSMISSRNLTTGSLLWQFHLPALGVFTSDLGEKHHYEVKDFIGVIDDYLFVQLNDRDILVLSVSTGDFVKHMKVADAFIGATGIEPPSRPDVFYNTKYIYNEEKAIIQGLFLDLYYEISVVDGQIDAKVYGLSDTYTAHNIYFRDIGTNAVIQGDELYFLLPDAGRFAILDTNTKLVTYVSDAMPMEDREDAFTKLKEIQVSGDKVYVLGNDRTLRVFEKEG